MDPITLLIGPVLTTHPCITPHATLRVVWRRTDDEPNLKSGVEADRSWKADGRVVVGPNQAFVPNLTVLDAAFRAVPKMD